MQAPLKPMNIVYAETLVALMTDNPQVLCLEADLGKAAGTVPLVKERFPRNFIDVGVAEANMISIAAGLAAQGKVPFCSSFCCFASRRVYDQATISVAYANNNVKIVGTGPGITQGPNGGTHMCFQDLAIMRAMPNIHVYSPCDPRELVAMMRVMAQTRQPTYMQLLRLPLPAVLPEDFAFDPQRATLLKKGKDVTLVTTGYTTHLALAAATKLAALGIDAELLHYSSVKPFDHAALSASARKTGRVVTVENQSIIGGLGSAVCEALAENYPCPVTRLGVPDCFGEVGTEEYLLAKHGFGVEDIVKAVAKPQK